MVTALAPSREKEATISLSALNPVAAELTESQFSPEKVEEAAIDCSCSFSALISDWMIVRSTPSWVAAVSFVLISSRTSLALLRPW